MNNPNNFFGIPNYQNTNNINRANTTQYNLINQKIPNHLLNFENPYQRNPNSSNNLIYNIPQRPNTRDYQMRNQNIESRGFINAMNYNNYNNKKVTEEDLMRSKKIYQQKQYQKMLDQQIQEKKMREELEKKKNRKKNRNMKKKKKKKKKKKIEKKN